MVISSRIARSIFPNPLLMTSVPSVCVATNIRSAKRTASARWGRGAEPSLFGEATPRAMREYCFCRPAKSDDNIAHFNLARGLFKQLYRHMSGQRPVYRIRP